MATSNNRAVKLEVEVETTGEDGLKRLGEGMRSIGRDAAAALPDVDRLAAEVNELQEQTQQRRQAEAAARAEQTAARRELEALRDALARLRAESTAATRQTVEHQQAETRLRVAIVDARAALRERNEALRAATAEARAAVAAEREHAAALDRVRAAHQAAAGAALQQKTAVAEAIGTMRQQLATLRDVALVATSGTLVGSLAKDLADVADGYAGLAARIKLVTADQQTFESSLREVFEIAQRTGTAVEEVGTLYVRLVQAGAQLNLTNADALRLAESVTQATQLSGASAQQAAASVTQFAQAIASGRLQGDELRSLLENSPRLAQALADGLGVAVGQLKELGSAGALTSQQVIAALQGQSDTLKREFDQLPLTVGRALTNLNTAWTEYVGNADRGSGASRTAAEAIQVLANNLDTLVSVLYSAGKAAAALAVINLARSFVESATGARAAAAAITASTVATVANTAAQAENAAATAGSVAAVGRMASILGTLKLISLVGVLTNLREIGTFLGEGAAKLLGYGRAAEELERTTRANEAASRAWAAGSAALAQEQRKAADAALGLTKESKALVAEFDGLIQKGEPVAQALRKVAKELDLSDARGIQTASAALDALGQRGALAADQIRRALADALDGKDLVAFETTARAAFDGSAQGARRLQAALDAIADQSLKRAGSSAEELATGFSEAASRAINDADTLARTLRDVGASSTDAGRLLAAALDKATNASNTERAVLAVIDRLKDLGRQGLLSGDQLAAGLDKARAKLDELRPGLNSVAEALRTFGLRTREELAATAEKLGAAYRVIANDVSVSLADKARAFKQYAEAAAAANGGVETSEVQLQRRILETKLEAAGLGDVLTKAMGDAARATERASSAQERYIGLLRAAAGIGPSQDGVNFGVRSPGGEANKVNGLTPIDSFGNLIRSTPSGGITRTGAAQFDPPDDSGEWVFDAEAYSRAAASPTSRLSTVDPRNFWRRSTGAAFVGNNPFPAQFGVAGGSTPTPTPTRAPSPTPGAGLQPINVYLGNGERIPAYVADRAAAERLIAALERGLQLNGES